MAEETTTTTTGKTLGSTIYGVFWLANLIYTIMYWHGWHILWNIFVPYSIVWDAVKKMGHIQ